MAKNDPDGRTRPRRRETALRSAARTVEYEYSMLLAGAYAIGRARTTEERNLVLEAFLVHARNMRDFFASSGRPDDILAIDFVQRMPRTAMPYLRSRTIRNRLNRLLAHPSYSRPRLRNDWQVREIVREVSESMSRFVESLQQESPNRVDWFGRVADLLPPRARL